MVTECYCDSCRKAGAVLEALPGAPAVIGQASGTHFVVQRKDRIAALSGTEHLREHRLTPESKTRRVVATCCNTPMFLDFADGHWFSIYAGRFAAESLPAVEERTMLKDMPEGFAPPPDARNSQRWSLRFMARLMAAWAAMRFRTPKTDWGRKPLA